MLGVQWYILFNVLAGAMRIPLELSNTLELVGATRARRWFYLYLPSVFPALVTGLITAAGGAWNASIVAEYYSYNGTVLTTTGLGAMISRAVDKADFSMLTASLTVMVIAVVSLNRLVWSRVYSLAQNRFRMDM